MYKDQPKTLCSVQFQFNIVLYSFSPWLFEPVKILSLISSKLFFKRDIKF